MAYSCCFSLGGKDFLDFLPKRFYNIDHRRAKVKIKPLIVHFWTARLLEENRERSRFKYPELIVYPGFFKMGQPRPLFCLFSVFSNKHHYNFYNKCVKKCPSNIQCRDSNLWPLELESLPITTRPELPHIVYTVWEVTEGEEWPINLGVAKLPSGRPT